MCRFVAYLGPPITVSSLITEPSNSLIHQSFHAEEREEPLNGDGFGIAWYEPRLSREPGLFRSVMPAWSNANLRQLARLTVSPCIFGHVRAASKPFSVSEVNCHPFVAGRYAFMHNGEIEGFDRLRRPLIERLSDDAFHTITGSTDSEHLFALFLDLLAQDHGDAPPEEAMAGALERAIGFCRELARATGVTGHCYLNLAVSDGDALVATRFSTDPRGCSSLHLHVGCRYVCEQGVCRMLAPEEGTGAVIVASEVLSDDPGWQTVPPDHVVLVRRGRAPTVRPLRVA